MTESKPICEWQRHERIGVLIVDSPPVNALSTPVRQALLDAVATLNRDETLDALVIRCAGRTFFPGADLREFGEPPRAPLLPDVVNAIEASAKPIVAAIHGTALGGGLEVAMACHFRVAAASAQLGLPEVKLGLLPGAGGTQRLPRLVGMRKALALITTGDSIGAAEAHASGLVHGVTDESGLTAAALGIARKATSGEFLVQRTGARPLAVADDALFESFLAANARKLAHQHAPATIVRALREGSRLPFDEALALERKLFLDLREGEQSKALRYVFRAERAVAEVPGIDATTATLPIESVGIVGAGTMGSGIALNFLLARLPVTLVERDQAALDRGVSHIRKTLERNVASGRTSAEDRARALGLLTPSLEYEALKAADLVIEAAYESMEVKQAIFKALDAIAKPHAILATNTSYLNIDEIAAVTRRPQYVLGLHFFSPANVMKLLEVVRTAQTSASVLATALALAKRIGKVAVVARVCHGFIGNRMLAVRRRECDRMILEGASPYAIDRVAEAFGLPMGPFRISDLAGLDLGWTRETSTGSTVRERLCELNRRGQKTRAGYYDYDDDNRARPAPLVQEVVQKLAAEHGITQREWSDAEILDRLLLPMIDEGRKIVAEGVALRASDVDVVWIHGYGWPRWRGGPMYYGDSGTP
jgi:3-hydroxyacyl-CoA dehydrogenase